MWGSGASRPRVLEVGTGLRIQGVGFRVEGSTLRALGLEG